MSKGLAVAVGGLALWYVINSGPDNPVPASTRYPLPKEIAVVETSLPYETRKIEKPYIDSRGKTHDLEKIVKTADIDFSKEFELITDRYRLVKDDDWLPSRLVGHTMSCFAKLFFWDYNAGWGLDSEKTKSVLSMLESNKDIKDLTVRINHNEGFYDWYRMNTEDKLTERNPFWYRWSIGSLTSFKDEIFAEFARGDYYNPLTKTVVLYSNIESVSAHELGHHKDFERYKTDWVYDIARIIPPVMVYQEWKASNDYAKKILSKDDAWQFNRYLVPALGAYVLSAVGMMAGFLFGKKD